MSIRFHPCFFTLEDQMIEDEEALHELEVEYFEDFQMYYDAEAWLPDTMTGRVPTYMVRLARAHLQSEAAVFKILAMGSFPAYKRKVLLNLLNLQLGPEADLRRWRVGFQHGVQRFARRFRRMSHGRRYLRASKDRIKAYDVTEIHQELYRTRVYPTSFTSKDVFIDYRNMIELLEHASAKFNDPTALASALLIADRTYTVAGYQQEDSYFSQNGRETLRLMVSA